MLVRIGESEKIDVSDWELGELLDSKDLRQRLAAMFSKALEETFAENAPDAYLYLRYRDKWQDRDALAVEIDMPLAAEGYGVTWCLDAGLLVKETLDSLIDEARDITKAEAILAALRDLANYAEMRVAKCANRSSQ